MAALNPQHVMQLYADIARLMGAMVVAARARDWEQLRDLENACRPLTHRLMAEEPGIELPADLKGTKLALLRKILEDDAAIRLVTQSWMEDLQTLIGSTQARQKLNKAYGPGLH